MQWERIAGGELLQSVAMLGVAPLDVPHGREDLMPPPRQPFDRVPSEACARTGDEDDRAHRGSFRLPGDGRCGVAWVDTQGGPQVRDRA